MMDHDDDTRHPELLYLLDNNVVFRSFATSPTCVSALFKDAVAQIHNLCSFSLQEAEFEPAVHFLSNGKILLTNVSQLTLNCCGEERVLDGCIHCIRLVPCNCKVAIFLGNSTLPSRFWLPKLATCRPSDNISRIYHIVNLASLQSFFSDTSLGDLRGSTYLNQPLPVQLPVFHHFGHKFHQFISKDMKRSHDLHKFAMRVRNDSVVFHELSDVVLDHMSEIIGSYDQDTLITSRFSSVDWRLTWSSILCSYISFIMVLYFCY